MSRPGAVVFDFGGVLITTIANQIGAVAASHDIDRAVMHEILLGPRESGARHPWHRAERGEIALVEIQGLLDPWARAHDVELHGDEMDRLLSPGGYDVVDVMLERVGALRTEGLLTGLLTNTFAEFRPTMQRDVDFDLFDVVVESFAVGARKPEPAIYAITAERLGVDHGAIAYLDDFEHNLTPARDLGWATVLVDDPLDALAELDAILHRSTDAAPDTSTGGGRDARSSSPDAGDGTRPRP
ncbi:HAD family hydrolase [Ilumatobacter sp.]|uniref:HAD family hydrolase n=1 Tax=Ilumatobacter sp. TaxID=1967498 RepID=UPI003B52F200